MKIPSFLRFIRRSRFYYFVNILGMSMSVAITLLSILVIYRELTADRFHKNISNIYCVEVDGRSATPFMCAEHFKNQLPGIGSFTRVQLWDLKFNVLKYGNNPPLDLDKIIRADPNFFSFFTFKFINGDPGTCLDRPESLVLTESSARKLFGSEEPMGKTVSYNKGQIILTVTAVVEDPPFNNSLDYNAVMSVRSLPVIYPPFNLPGPFFWNFDTFVTLDGVKPDDRMNTKASEIFLASIPPDGIKEAREIFKSKFMVRLIPYSSVYFNKEFGTSLRKGDIKQVYLFSIIGALIILVALVNYINLSNAGATMRVRDVMIRKTMGEPGRTLLVKLLGESVITSFIAVLFALILGKILTNVVNNQQLLTNPVEFFSFPHQVLILVAGSLLIGIAGGLYPAVSLASVNPSVSQRHSVISGAVFIRKVLLVFQFFVTACLLICSIVISRQYKKMTEIPAGFDSENVIYIRMGRELKSKYHPFAEELARIPQVLKLANARYGFVGGRNPGRSEFVCKGNNVNFDAISFTTDTGFMEMLGLHLAEGNSFRDHDNIAHKLIINESAHRMMGAHDDLSQIVLPDKVHGITWQVVGVVKDFNTRSMQYPISPYVFYFVPGDADMDGLYIKVRNGEEIGEAMDMIMKISQEFSPDEPVNPEILDDAIAAIYKEDNNRRKMFLFFSVFTMLISCMGLYALSGFILGRRTKETGIRKVFGADKESVFIMLSSELLKIVLVGYLLALPLSWYILNRWLKNFAIKTELSPWIFVLSGMIIFLIAILSVAVEIRKISSKNVAEVTRYE